MLFKYKRLLLACVALFVLITFCAAVMVYKTINDFKSSPAIFDKQVYSLKYGENATKVIEDFSSNPITKQIRIVKGQMVPKNHETDFLLIGKVRVAINAPNGAINK